MLPMPALMLLRQVLVTLLPPQYFQMIGLLRLLVWWLAVNTQLSIMRLLLQQVQAMQALAQPTHKTHRLLLSQQETLPWLHTIHLMIVT